MDGSMGLVYMPTFTIVKVKEMQVNICHTWILWELFSREMSVFQASILRGCIIMGIPKPPCHPKTPQEV